MFLSEGLKHAVEAFDRPPLPAGQVVPRAQLVQNRATDACLGVVREMDPAVRAVSLDGLVQPQDPGAEELTGLHPPMDTDGYVLHNLLHQWQKVLQQLTHGPPVVRVPSPGGPELCLPLISGGEM